MKAAGLVSTVQEADAFTIFAPTNDAFAKVPEAALSSLLADKEALTVKIFLKDEIFLCSHETQCTGCAVETRGAGQPVR